MPTPNLTRRKFFGLLGGVVAAQAAKPIFILPPPQGWTMAGPVLIRVPIVIEAGSTFGLYQPDGGFYPPGVGTIFTMEEITLEEARRRFPKRFPHA